MKCFPTCRTVVVQLMILLLMVGLAWRTEVRRAAGKKAIMTDPELSKFKTEIDLRALAASFGYELDRNKSWRGPL